MSKPPHPSFNVVASAYPAFFLVWLVYWLFAEDKAPLFDLLVFYFVVHFPAYIALLLEANVRYCEGAWSQHGAWYMVWLPLYGAAVAFKPPWWSYVPLFIVVVFFFFSLALFLI